MPVNTIAKNPITVPNNPELEKDKKRFIRAILEGELHVFKQTRQQIQDG